ncbi:hypothetical protein ACSV5M_16140 [Cellvibrio sp. ARAG 10.3]|uniref:hypothetical protein n=1 Tax=Cellvibrio sp. ARAG 10.3 TaxID=3451358 RepID=UPI003F489B24
MRYLVFFLVGFAFNTVQAVEWLNKSNNIGTFMGYEDGYNQKDAMYFCRENNRTDGTTVVGKAIVKQGRSGPLSTAVCYIPWGGKENSRKENFDLLVLPEGWRFSHIDSQASLINLDSYERGNPPKATYGCAHYPTGIIGKYFVEHNACYYPYGGKERKETNKERFRVLTYCNTGISHIGNGYCNTPLNGY